MSKLGKVHSRCIFESGETAWVQRKGDGFEMVINRAYFCEQEESDMLNTIFHELDEIVSITRRGRDVHGLIFYFHSADITDRGGFVCGTCGAGVDEGFIIGGEPFPLIPFEFGENFICVDCMAEICSGCRYYERCLEEEVLTIYCKDIDRWVEGAEKLLGT